MGIGLYTGIYKLQRLQAGPQLFGGIKRLRQDQMILEVSEQVTLPGQVGQVGQVGFLDQAGQLPCPDCTIGLA